MMPVRDKYDIVIVGASIAGLCSGMLLARHGFSVCIIDRRKIIGTPVRCGEATGNRKELARFIEINENWIAGDIRGLAVHFNGNKPLYKDIADNGVVLHRDLFEQDMAQHAKTHGAEIILETGVCGLFREKDGQGYSGVVCGHGDVIRAGIIIGADGCESKVGRWAGITQSIPLADAFSSVQYRLRSDFCNNGYLNFFVGSSHISRGYIWVFPKSENEISIGAGRYGCKAGQPKAQEIVDRFIRQHIPGTEPYDCISGCVPLPICPRLLGKGNVMVIGDAARQVNPLTAGGIMNTLEAADMAVKAIVRQGIADPQRAIKRYSHGWAATQRRQQKIYYLLKEVYLDSSDTEIRFVIEKAAAIIDKTRNIDRSKPFTFPAGIFLRVFVLFLTKFVKFIPVVWR